MPHRGLKLVDMKSSEKVRESMKESALTEKPLYPYGLRISLSNEILKKLGIKKMPAVGDMFYLGAEVDVTDVSEQETAGEGKMRSVGLQITHMGLGPSTAKGEDGFDSASRKLYPE